MVSTGEIGNEARRYANKIMTDQAALPDLLTLALHVRQAAFLFELPPKAATCSVIVDR